MKWLSKTTIFMGVAAVLMFANGLYVYAASATQQVVTLALIAIAVVFFCLGYCLALDRTTPFWRSLCDQWRDAYMEQTENMQRRIQAYEHGLQDLEAWFAQRKKVT